MGPVNVRGWQKPISVPLEGTVLNPATQELRNRHNLQIIDPRKPFDLKDVIRPGVNHEWRDKMQEKMIGRHMIFSRVTGKVYGGGHLVK
jgi:hypothetical protein